MNKKNKKKKIKLNPYEKGIRYQYLQLLLYRAENMYRMLFIPTKKIKKEFEKVIKDLKAEIKKMENK